MIKNNRVPEQFPKTRLYLIGAGDRSRTGTVSLPQDFESSTSANSITPAKNQNLNRS